MSLDGFLTFIGLIIAAYAITDRTSRLRLSLDLKLQVFIAAAFALLIFLLESQLPILSILPKEWENKFIEFPFGGIDDPLNNKDLAFLVVIFWGILSFYMIKTSKPRLRKIKSLSVLVYTLADQKQFHEIISLVDSYLPIIRKLLAREFVRQQAYVWLANKAGIGSLAQLLANANKKSPSKQIRRLYKGMISITPSLNNEREIAEEIISLLTNSPEFRKILLTRSSKFAIEFIKLPSVSTSDYIDHFLRDSISTSESHLRIDLQKNNTIEYYYYLDEKNVFLYGLLEDMSFAERIGVWKPIGDAALRIIQEDKVYRDTLNSAIPMDESKTNSDPIFCTIRFFDILVKRAAEKGIEHHMWLMYLGYIISELSKNSDCTSEVIDINAEFPNLGCKLIFEAQLCLGDWVRLSKRLPPENIHLAPETAGQAESSGNIPYWATRTLYQATGELLRNEKLTTRFRAERLEQFLRVVMDIPTDGNCKYLREYALDNFFEEIKKETDLKTRGSIHNVISNVDQFIQSEFSSYFNAFRDLHEQ